jgi:class 3 adenylate cyclase
MSRSEATPEVTIVMIEGRRMMRLAKELPEEHFDALLGEYAGVLSRLLGEMGGGDVEVEGDTAVAAFSSAKHAALAAVAAQRAVAAHDWPHALRPAVSVGLDSGEAATSWADPTASHCADLCDAAEGGQIFVSPKTAALLEREELDDLSLRDLGEQTTRRTRRAVRAYELVFPVAAA